MAHIISLVRRAIRFRALPLVGLACGLVACDSADQLTSTSESPTTEGSAEPVFSSSFRGGIPFGTWALPTTLFGDVYNGAMRNLSPEHLLKELAAIQARGGKVILSLAGKETHYRDDDGHFSLSRWKARIDRYRGVNFSSYIDDGTVIGHYIIDEPNDPANWNGQPVTPPTIEEMAAYSKQLWPGMPAIVRADPGYMAKWSGTYRSLDAAWAQYVVRKGEVGAYITRRVADAKSKGLALVVGLNIRKGGMDREEMTASQIESWGSRLLDESYPCAFISWEYDEFLLREPGVTNAMRTLSEKASEHASKSCHGEGRGSPPPPQNDPPTAAFDAPSCTAGVPCQFNDRSTDSDGTIATRSWSFGAGATSSETNPSNTFATAGTHSVTLAVTDDDGVSRSVSHDVTVRARNSQPTAAFTSPRCTVGVPCQFSDESSDSDGSIASRSWSFGGGATSTQANPSNTYAAAGQYSVTLTVTDDQGATSSITQVVRVELLNRVPAAAFAAPRCTAGNPCQFSDGSTDSDGTIATRSWAFGNGTSSTEANPSTIYAAAGPYRVTLTVTDDGGATSSVTRSITVGPGALPGSTPIVLGVSTFVRDDRQFVWLSWSRANGATVDVYRNGVLRENTKNDRKYIRGHSFRGTRTYSYRVCEAGTSRCSNTVRATLN
jgi:PKD repeat protein